MAQITFVKVNCSREKQASPCPIHQPLRDERHVPL